MANEILVKANAWSWLTPIETAARLVPKSMFNNAIEIARAFVALAEPKWLDRPDSDGAWWLCLENETMDLVHVKLAGNYYIINEGMKAIGTFAEEKYAKAVIPEPPGKEP